MSDLTFGLQTDVLTVPSTTPVCNVIGQMQQRHMSYALVLDQTQLVGIFTQRDAARAIAHPLPPAELTIAAVMTQPVICIQAAEVHDAGLVLERLRHHTIRHLPVTDEWGRVTGIIILSTAALYDIITNLQQTVTLQTQALEQEVAHRQALATAINSIGERYATVETHLDDILNRAIASIICFRIDADDRHYYYEYCSAGCEQVFGYSPQELMADSTLWLSRVFPDDIETVVKPAWEKALVGADHQKEYRFFCKDGSLRWVLSNVTSRYDAASHSWVVTATDTDITQQKQTEAALRASELRFRAIVEQSATGIAQTCLEGTFLKVNQRFCDIVGYSAAELAQLHLRDTLHADDVALVKQKQRQLVYAEIQSFSLENRYSRKDGTVVWGRMTVSLIKDKAGWPQYFISMIEDIQQQKLAENTLRQKEEQLRLASDLAYVGIWDWHIHTDELFWNENSSRLMGLPITQLQGKNQIWIDRLHPNDRDRIWQAANHALQTHTSYETEYRVVWLDGTIRWILDKGHGIYDETGQAVRMVGCVIDITDRKQAEAALAESEMRFRQLANHTHEVFWMTNADGSKVLYISPAFETIWGVSTNYLYQHPTAWMDAVIPSDRPRVEAIWANLPRASFELEYQIEQPDGSYRWVWDRGNAIYNEQGEIYRIGGLIEDITDRKQTEAALRNSEARFRAIFEQVAVGIAEIDLSGHYLRVNQGYCHVLGYTESELLTLTFQDITYADDLDLTFDCVQQIMTSDSHQCIREKRYVRKDGQVRWTTISICLIRNELGTPQHILCVLQDIHDRKLAEQSLRDSKERFREITETIEDVFFIEPPDAGQFLYVSPAIEKIFGHTTEAIYQNPLLWSQLVHADDRDIVLASLEQQRQGLPSQKEYRITRPDGTQRWLFARTFPIYDATGEVLRHIGLTEDITDRKQAESALRDSEERFRQITENINEVFFIESPNVDATLYISPVFERDWGLPLANLHGNSGHSAVQVHPGDRPHVAQAIAQQRRGEPTQKEYRIVYPDGFVRWIFARTFPIYDEAGTLLRHVGIAEDMTTRKTIEEALRQQTELLQTILDHVPAMITMLDQQSQFLWVNREWENVLGWKIEDGQTRDLFAEFYPGPAYRQHVYQAIQTIQHSWTEFKTRTRYGMVIDTAWANVQLSDGRMIGIGQDISDRKHAEAQISASLKEKESLLQEIHHRVKNNLQVISSLLKLQANRIDDPQAREALEDSWSRVDSMALVHESLYRSDNFSIIDFETYIRTLITNLFHIYDVTTQDISVTIEVSAAATLNLDQAVPCGLIINELISNALKHGLKDQQTGQIDITFFKNSHNQLVLRVANSGTRLPPAFDPNTSQTMGLRLVLSLVNQLEGVLEVEGEEFTVFRIVFDSQNF